MSRVVIEWVWQVRVAMRETVAIAIVAMLSRRSTVAIVAMLSHRSTVAIVAMLSHRGCSLNER